MQEFDHIKDMVYCELDEISNRGSLDMNTVKVVGELVDILKDIGSIEMFEEGINIQDEGYSFADGYNMGNGGYSQRRMPVYYNNGNSYRNGRNYGGRGYMPRGGYSREDSKNHMIEKLHGLMNEAVDQKDKDAIHELIKQMENN